MSTKQLIWKYFEGLELFLRRRMIRSNIHGQAVVEFTLIFLLFLVVAWIPADFGLALYTGQLAQNASREGSRIAAADPTLLTQMGGPGPVTCMLPCSGAINILAETAKRVSSALLSNGSITLQYDPPPTGPTCNKVVRVRVVGTYNYFFYHLLRVFGHSVSPTTIVRQTDMRWEHQATCE